MIYQMYACTGTHCMYKPAVWACCWVCVSMDKFGVSVELHAYSTYTQKKTCKMIQRKVAQHLCCCVSLCESIETDWCVIYSKTETCPSVTESRIWKAKGVVLTCTYTNTQTNTHPHTCIVPSQAVNDVLVKWTAISERWLHVINILLYKCQPGHFTQSYFPHCWLHYSLRLFPSVHHLPPSPLLYSLLTCTPLIGLLYDSVPLVFFFVSSLSHLPLSFGHDLPWTPHKHTPSLSLSHSLSLSQ